jgi:putative ABC transport system ATP-binding protein
VLDIFEQLSADGLTLVVITHDEHVASRAHRRVRMVDGMLVEADPMVADRGGERP